MDNKESIRSYIQERVKLTEPEGLEAVGQPRWIRYLTGGRKAFGDPAYGVVIILEDNGIGGTIFRPVATTGSGNGFPDYFRNKVE